MAGRYRAEENKARTYRIQAPGGARVAQSRSSPRREDDGGGRPRSGGGGAADAKAWTPPPMSHPSGQASPNEFAVAAQTAIRIKKPLRPSLTGGALVLLKPRADGLAAR